MGAMMDAEFTSAHVLETRGRGLIGLSTCKTCGVTLVIEDNAEVDVLDLHSAWHKKLDMQAAREVS